MPAASDIYEKISPVQLIAAPVHNTAEIDAASRNLRASRAEVS
jgi:hypothetical protein